MVLELFAESVLDTPEAAGGDGAQLDIFGHGLSDGFGVEIHFGGGGEGAEEAREERGHGDGHDNGRDEDDFAVEMNWCRSL